ncbi:MAG: histone deacetylase family protein [Calditrichia bacterium]
MTPWKNIHFFYHPLFLRHLEDVAHPETPDRLRIIIEYLKEQSVWEQLTHKKPQPAAVEWLKRNHDSSYVDSLLGLVGTEPCIVDGGDTIVTAHSIEAALRAAGAAIEGVDALVSNQTDSVFCAVRPPGHHAEYAEAMGFCLFNNVAIAARYALEHHKLERVFIFDWDVHHGNGTHYSFEHTADVFFCSMHQEMLFPSTGAASESGMGEGSGYSLNLPLPPGCGDDVYLKLLDQKVLPAITAFRPDLFILSAGFDAHTDDPLANMQLSTEAFAEMTLLLRKTLQPLNGGKILSVLEGGYHQRNLAESVYAHLKALAESSGHL